jgi:hypothetical protein
MDLFLFVAEHDDHHLARITELVRIRNRKRYSGATVASLYESICSAAR